MPDSKLAMDFERHPYPPTADDSPPPYVLPDKFTEDQLRSLRNYDTVILLDNSGSMKPHWEAARKALCTLAVIASKYDTDGIEIHFLNDYQEHKANHEARSNQASQRGFLKRIFSSPKGKATARDRPMLFKTEKDVQKLFDQVMLGGPTDIALRLDEMTQDLLMDLRNGKNPKSVNYIIITDGAATDKPEDSIVHIAKQLDRYGAPLSQLGIQFVQIGSDPDATAFLQELDNNLKNEHKIRDMVDTEPYDPRSTSDDITPKLVKIMLGGINRKVDDEPSHDIQGGRPKGSRHYK